MIILSLGSNLSSKFGNKIDNLNRAVLLLKNNGISILKKSSIYESLSYPDKNNPKFVNLIIVSKTDISLKNLMFLIFEIEKELGRKRSIKNAPRTCDIDIIDYKRQIKNINYNNLSISVPHKNLEFRNFVLYPLEEIYPEWRHPKTKVIISSLIEKLPEIDRKSILKVKKN